jgi:glycosyltransferase involved in cell wall biosynthesis
LSKKYNINLVVADGLGDEKKSGVVIYDVGVEEGRLGRIFKTTKKVLQKAIELDSDLYHLHDPELMFVGLKLKKLGKKVVFDAHEDLPKQVMAKHYLGSFSKKILSFMVAKLELLILKRYDMVISATPIIRDKFLDNSIDSVDINNFPMTDELMDIEPSFQTNTICYIGLLYETRGIREMVKAIENLDVKLIVAGKFFDASFEEEIRALKGWEQVNFRGFASRDEVKEILKSSIAGLVTLHPTPSYVEAYPVKMFEYMSAGVAVVASDFPLYREFVEGSRCGVCVDPLDVDKISDAILALLEDKRRAKEMGESGKEAIKRVYNWHNEEQKLIESYRGVLDG